MKRVVYFMSLCLLLTIRTSHAATFVVDNLLNADPLTAYVLGDGTNSLRKCIRLANVDGVLDNIRFNIPAPYLIPITANLVITNPVLIDGYTQPTASAGNLLVEVSGSGGIQIFRLNAGSNGSTIRGLVINSTAGINTAIYAIGSANHVFSGNYIGTNAAGSALGGAIAMQYGIDLDGATGCTIGGTSGALTRNLISACSNIAIRIRNLSHGTTVLGNFVGTTASGNAPLANSNNGIDINNSNTQMIGGSTYASKNVIGASTIGVNVSTCAMITIKGNFIGIGADGFTAIGNTNAGIKILGTTSTITIGGTLLPERNIVSSNGNDGINLSGTLTTLNFQNNYIGFDSTGMVARGNTGDGIDLSNGNTVIIGGSTYSARNVIGNNTQIGIRMSTNATSTVVKGNFIGVAVDNTAAGNGVMGMLISSAVAVRVGGPLKQERNIIASNLGDGINMGGTITGLTVQNNYIGFDSTGTVARGNSGDGMDINNASTILIGGSAYNLRNVIGNNTQMGIRMNTNTISTIIKGNFIGVAFNNAAAGNTGGGIQLSSAVAVTVGGSLKQERNVVGSNGNDGINMSGTITGLTIQNNYVGFDSTGIVARGNTGNGIVITGASTVLIGGSAYNLRNVIGNNTLVGLRLTTSTIFTTIKANFIGLTANGAAAGNGNNGIQMNAAVAVVIGGASVIERNVIGSNGADGINLNTITGVTIQNNYIGFDSTGLIARTNAGDGLEIGGASTILIGGSSYNLRNVIGNNMQVGIRLSNSTVSTFIKANFIGLSANGAAAGNTGNGIQSNTATSMTIGGSVLAERNVIGSNGGDGMNLNIITGLTIQNNYIGFDSTGLLARGNLNDGIEISGTSSSTVLVGGATSGLGNVIGNNSQDGLRMNNTIVSADVKGNIIGLAVNGMTAAGNGTNGIEINTSVSLTIGGSTIPERNIVSSNLQRGISVSNAPGVIIKGNFVGLAKDGTTARGNTQHGIGMSICNNAVIGGPTLPERNVVSSNLQRGVEINNSNSVTFVNNYVGVDSTGSLIKGNIQAGVAFSVCSTAVVGGTSTTLRNIISNNGYDGLRIDNSVTPTVQGNYIGVDITGLLDFGNGENGVNIYNAGIATVGGSTYSARNIISGNGQDGIILHDNCGGSIIKANFVGVGVDGKTVVGNHDSGIRIYGNTTSNGVIIGGSLYVERNIVSGNGLPSTNLSRDGIRIEGNASSHIIKGNYCGTDSTGTIAIGNKWAGISLNEVSNAIVGGTGPFEGNICAANTHEGMYLRNAVNCSIIGNFVGTDKTASVNLGNGEFGINVRQASLNNTIGGTPAQQNIIAYTKADAVDSSGTGVYIEYRAQYNKIVRNKIYCNASLGISRATLGNEGIAAPAVTAADANSVSGTGSVNGDSIHVYHTNVSGGACDCEGETFIGATVVSGGTWSITHGLNYSIPTAYDVTATETTANKSTSQFSVCNAALPVEFVSFTVKKFSDLNIAIRWSTAWEVNNSYFLVERKNERGEFDVLSRVTGRGSYQGVSNYSAEDQNPLIGINYYRITQVDVDGRSSSTAIRAIQVDGDGLQILLTTEDVGIISPEATKATLSIYSELGQELLQKQLQLNANTYYPISIGLQNGVYLFYVTTEEKSVWKKVLVR